MKTKSNIFKKKYKEVESEVDDNERYIRKMTAELNNEVYDVKAERSKTKFHNIKVELYEAIELEETDLTDEQLKQILQWDQLLLVLKEHHFFHTKKQLANHLCIELKDLEELSNVIF